MPRVKSRRGRRKGKRRKHPQSARKRWHRNQLLRRDGDACHYCGEAMHLGDPTDARRATIDHVLPLSKGGLDELRNMVLACNACNQAKGDSPPDDDCNDGAPDDRLGAIGAPVSKCLRCRGFGVVRADGSDEPTLIGEPCPECNNRSALKPASQPASLWRQLRTACGYSLGQAARHIGVSVVELSAFERGREPLPMRQMLELWAWLSISFLEAQYGAGCVERVVGDVPQETA